MPTYFITATGTDIGKTVVSTALCLALARRKVATAYLKPVQTGCLKEGDVWVAPDLTWAGSRFAASKQKAGVEAAVLCGYQTPCSPHLAARLEKHPLPYAAIIRTTRHIMKEAPAVIVEGAGGLMTPLDQKRTWLDFLRDTRLPTIVVASTALGTINHTLLTVAALRSHRLPIAGLVFLQSQPGAWGVIERENVTFLPKTTRLPLLGVLRHQADMDDPAKSRLKLMKFGESLLKGLV